MLAIPFCVHRARAIFFASLFTRPLFISPTRKPRAGLNTRVNPIRCKCFRARPSLVLPVLPPLPRPPSPFLSSDFFAERLSRCLLRRLAHGAYIYGRVCARFEASHSRGLYDNVIVSAEGRNKFAGWNVSLSLSLTHILLLSHLPSPFLLLSLLCNLGRRAKFIHSPANPVTAYFTYREGGSRANVLGAFLNTRYR